MSKEELKGGKADNMSVSDIAKLHGVSSKDIEKEIEAGLGVEKEHTPSKIKQREISKDHTVEDPEYYTNPVTGLLAKEKETMEKMNEEAKKMMALAGIKEDDKKFLTNESFSESDKSMANLDFTKSNDDNFIIMEFDQEDVESGPDDDKLYKIG